MKLKNLFKLSGLALLLASFTLTGCFPDNKLVYDGPLQVEFPYPGEDDLLLLVQDTYEIKFQLIGKQQEHDLTIEFEVDDASTAVEGQHFELDSHTAVIPANESFGYINVTALPANISSAKTLIITLLGDTEGKVKAAQNYKSFELGLKP